MGWLFTAAFFTFIFWRIRRGKERAAEMAASGELRSPLYWIGCALAFGVLALSLYLATLKPSDINMAWWLLVAALFAAALGVRRALRWRYPH
jgi:hypothetical protein